MTSEPQRLELTPDLLEYIKAVVVKEAPKHCRPRLSRPTSRRSDFDEKPWDDVVQWVTLRVLRRPPKYDPSRGASVKTLLFTVVKRALMKYGTRDSDREDHYPQMPKGVEVSEGLEEGKSERTPVIHQVSRRRHADLTRSGWSMDDILQYIPNDDSKALCKLVIECDGNMSAAARKLGVAEGTVRNRLKMLGPKLLAAGFDPFSTKEET